MGTTEVCLITIASIELIELGLVLHFLMRKDD
jgi:hypothetical protein